MDSYIVRVYRRGQDHPEQVAGTVEAVGADERRSFRNFPELVNAIREAVSKDEDLLGVTSVPHL